MRTYLVVIDDTAEARIALRFAARRAAKTGGGVDMLALIAPAEFAPWGGVQAAMEEEGRLKAEAMATQAAGELVDELGIHPALIVREGEAAAAIHELLAERTDIAALVLGAAAKGGPGPLVELFSAEAGTMRCPLMVVPGCLTDEELDRLS